MLGLLEGSPQHEQNWRPLERPSIRLAIIAGELSFEDASITISCCSGVRATEPLGVRLCDACPSDTALAVATQLLVSFLRKPARHTGAATLDDA